MADLSVNHSELRASAAEELRAAKEDFLKKLRADETYIDANGDNIVPDMEKYFPFKPFVDINLSPVDGLADDLEDAGFDLPQKPSALNNLNIDKYRRHVFEDTRLDGFEDKLNAIYSGFTTPTAYRFNTETLEEAIQTAFYQYQYDRDEEDLRTAIEQEAAEWAEDGYCLAPGAMAYEVSQKINAFDRQRTEKTEDVFNGLAQTVQKNIQWSIENGVAIEQLHMDFAIKYSELSKTFIDSAVDAYIAEIEKRIDEQRAQLMKIDELVKAHGLDTRADIKKHELELSERTARLAAYVGGFNAYISNEAGLIQEKIKLAQNIANGYGGIFASYGSKFSGVTYEE